VAMEERPKAWRGERGAVTVEFILTATLLFLILFSVVEFAFIFNAKLIMTGAAREGARRAAKAFGKVEDTGGGAPERPTAFRVRPAWA